MICEKCGEICYLIDVEITFPPIIGYATRIQYLIKTFKCIKCGTEIEVPPHPNPPEGHFVSEGEMLVWKPGKKENLSGPE